MKEETRVDGPWEFGIKPVKRNSKEDWEEVRKLAMEGKMDKIPADIFVKHY
jgi:DNA mismatch repair protein MutH